MIKFLDRLRNNFLYVNWLLILFVYYCISMYTGNSLLFPKISEVFKSILENVLTFSGLKIIFNTIKTVFLASFISLVLGTVFSILGNKNRVFKFFLVPFISIIKSLPTMGLILLVIIYWKLKTVPLIVGVAISLGMVYDLILSSIENIDKKIVEMATLYKIKKFQQFKTIYVPWVYFYLSKSFNSLITLIFKVVIAGEVIAGIDNTIGGELINQKNNFNTDIFFAWLIVVVIISNFLELCFEKLDKISRKWEKYD
ncbi:MAG: ABC transporter permease subunit [Fusobacteriaceae bacterium]